MGRRGPKPTPKSVLDERGSEHAKYRKSDTEAPVGADPSGIKLPAYLDREAKAEWKRIVPRLKAYKILDSMDQATLVTYCQAWSEWVGAVKLLQKVGDYIVTKNGEKKLHPAHTKMERAFDRFRRIALEYGMTPASRTRIFSPTMYGRKTAYEKNQTKLDKGKKKDKRRLLRVV